MNKVIKIIVVCLMGLASIGSVPIKGASSTPPLTPPPISTPPRPPTPTLGLTSVSIAPGTASLLPHTEIPKTTGTIKPLSWDERTGFALGFASYFAYRTVKSLYERATAAQLLVTGGALSTIPVGKILWKTAKNPGLPELVKEGDKYVQQAPTIAQIAAQEAMTCLKEVKEGVSGQGCSVIDKVDDSISRMTPDIKGSTLATVLFAVGGYGGWSTAKNAFSWGEYLWNYFTSRPR